MNRLSDGVKTGTVLSDFSLISYDQDSGLIRFCKEFEDGSVWDLPVRPFDKR